MVTEEQYFFYEWLIIEKKVTEEIIKNMSNNEFDNLKREYLKKLVKERLE